MVIDVRNLSLRRGQHTILSNVSWKVQEGEHWCLLGLNGSGKTMLLSIITGYIWPTEGTVSVLGKTFGTCDLRELRKSIGWVSASLQQQLHGHETAREIVLSGKFATIGLYDRTDRCDEERALSLMEMLGCQSLADRTYDTLSQGERQRVMIARALMPSPRLLILDEPCTGLDLLAREQLLHTIETVARQPDGPTLVYVTHHVEEIMPCFTHTLLLKNGEVFRSGKTPNVLTPDSLREFFDCPVEIRQRDERTWVVLA